MLIVLKKSPREDKKFRVTFEDKKTVDFGGKGYSDYTIHNDNERRNKYLKRHKKRENWSKKGIRTAGFWARWLLWSETSLSKAIQTIENKFNVDIRN
jgi:hypothetical protein